MSERDGGGQKFSRRDLFSHFKPKEVDNGETAENTLAPVDPWRLKLTRRELITSALSGSALGVVNALVTSKLEEVNIHLGQPSAKDTGKQKPSIIDWGISALISGIPVPYVEESIFRAMPSESFPTSGYRWDVGIPTSTVFALFHNIKSKWGVIPVGVSAERIPLPQFVAGLLFWKMVREGGRGKSMVAHGAYNISSLATHASKLVK